MSDQKTTIVTEDQRQEHQHQHNEEQQGQVEILGAEIERFNFGNGRVRQTAAVAKPYVQRPTRDVMVRRQEQYLMQMEKVDVKMMEKQRLTDLKEDQQLQCRLQKVLVKLRQLEGKRAVVSSRDQ